mmetsp:Transcript_18125/g.47810  ORF Transcript_18125/g.47810 Transcript_18125/m.47810 type:complete len:87 (+) Transcript_18125:1249-1509(+)
MGGGQSTNQSNTVLEGGGRARVQSVKGTLVLENDKGKGGRKRQRRPSLMLGDTLNFGENLEWSKIAIEGEIGRGNFGCVYKVRTVY